MTPKGMTVRPSFASRPGMMVWSGRLPGAIVFGWSGSITKLVARLWKSTPVRGLTSPEPKT